MYNIIRFYYNDHSKVIARGLSYEAALEHCSLPEAQTSKYFDEMEETLDTQN